MKPKYKIGELRRFKYWDGDWLKCEVIGLKKKLFDYTYLIEYTIIWTDLGYSETLVKEVREKDLY